MEYLNKEDKFTSLYVNIEAAQAAREDVPTAKIVSNVPTNTSCPLTFIIQHTTVPRKIKK